MQSDIHPPLVESKITCLSCGNVLKTLGTQKEMQTELCSQCHPFYTGKQVLVDTAGQVDRFKKRMKVSETRQAETAKLKPAKAAVQKPEEEEKNLSNEELLQRVRRKLTEEENAKKSKKSKAATAQADA